VTSATAPKRARKIEARMVLSVKVRMGVTSTSDDEDLLEVHSCGRVV